MTRVVAAREARGVGRGLATAEMLVQRSRRAVEHYATEGFRLAADNGQVVPYLDPEDSDDLSRLRDVAAISRMDELEEMAADLPLTFGSRALQVSDRPIGVIGSGEIAALLRGTADIHYWDSAVEQTDLKNVDVLVVALPVIGREPVLSSRDLDEITQRILPLARKTGIPTVAITLSDPWRSNSTSVVAGHVDWLLSTDPGAPDAYGKHMQHPDRVRVVASHFTPLRFSPVGRNRHRQRGALFSGRLPGKGQPERLRALRNIFTGLRREGVPLTLASTNVLNGLGEKARGLYPTEYAGHLTHDPTEDLRSRVVRLFDLHVLAHLKPGSWHAHPHETLEALASGGACLSTYSVAMNNDYPHVLLPDGPEDAALEAALFMTDEKHLHELQMEGVRRAFARQTSDHLLSSILRVAGVEEVGPRHLVVWRSHTDDSDAEVFANQVVAPDIELRRISSMDPTPENAIIEILVGRQVTGRHHLVQDLVNAFRMASVRRVFMSPATPETSVFEIVPDPPMEDGDATAVWVGPGSAEFEGTFVMDATALRNGTASSEASGAKQLSVVVPVYNNGPYLVRKCLESLRRSSAFPEMEIILVDDGSTSAETRAIVRDMQRRWGNVRAYLYPVGGSGSASRPRNKGLEMVTTPWVTYLDPDNEAVGDGYARLLSLCRHRKVDFAIGDMLRYAKSRTLTRNVGILSSVIRTDSDGVGDVPPDALARTNFQPMSIQALVADAAWLKSLNLEQPLGALGQDSLFFQQMLHAARSIALLNEPVHTYYGEVAGSMVNTVTPAFFRKYLPLEAARSQWLHEEGLFDEYVRRRMRRYVTVWFLPKFNKLVLEKDKEEAFEILRVLCDTYELDIHLSPDGMTANLDD